MYEECGGELNAPTRSKQCTAMGGNTSSQRRSRCIGDVRNGRRRERYRIRVPRRASAYGRNTNPYLKCRMWVISLYLQHTIDTCQAFTDSSRGVEKTLYPKTTLAVDRSAPPTPNANFPSLPPLPVNVLESPSLNKMLGAKRNCSRYRGRLL